MRDEAMLRWHDGARAATFDFFEPVSDVQLTRWAGSFGRSDSETTSLGIMAAISGIEVSVESSPTRRGRPLGSRRSMVSDLLWHLAIEDSELELPLSFTVVADVRSIDVEGKPVAFEGVRVEGAARWIGTGEHHDVTIRVTSSGVAQFGLRRCIDWEGLPETGPMSSY